MADRSQGSCLWSRRRPFSSMRPQRTLLLCRSIPTIIFIVVLRLVVGLSLLTHLKLLTRLPDNHVLLKRQLTLNVLQSWCYSSLNSFWASCSFVLPLRTALLGDSFSGPGFVLNGRIQISPRLGVRRV